MKTIQGYVYTLPEQFIEDTSVPFRWKLFALINGFWLSGRPVFASNSFFAEKIGCGERHIQRSLDNLEKMHLIQRAGDAKHRRIVPFGTLSVWETLDGDVADSGGTLPESVVGTLPESTPHIPNGSLSTRQKIEKQGSISVQSISEEIPEIGISDSSKEEENDISIVETDEDGNEIKRKVKKSPRDAKNRVAQRVVNRFSELVRKINTSLVVNDRAGYILVLKALNSGFTEHQLLNHITDWFVDQSDEKVISITAAFSTYSLNQFRLKEGI
jgi:hypothetical protein